MRILLLFLFLHCSYTAEQNGCEVKHAFYNIVCSRFEFWCVTRKNVMTYEVLCKNVTLKPPLTLKTPEKVQDIEIHNSNVPILTTNMFADFKNIVRLYVQLSNTREIQANAFKGASKLDWLIMKNNNISIINPKAFVGLDKLNVLNLNLNNLTELRTYTFEGLESLKYLSIKENKIRYIEDNTFSKMKNLGVIFLNDNLLPTISDNLLFANLGLRIIWLQNNNIKNFPTKFFKHKSLFREIDFANNNLISVDFTDYVGNISLDNNSINKIFPLTISQISFSMNSNNVSEISENIFPPAKYLESIYLNNNRISNIHKDAFRNLTKLKTLSLSNNLISSVPLGLFQDLRMLESLNLSGNQIQKIESGIFTGLISLETLDLSSNKISNLQISSLYPLKQLRSFNLNDNSLKTIDTQNLVTHLVSLQALDIDNNFWKCDWLSASLILFDKRRVNILHGSNMNSANVHGIICDTDDNKVDNNTEQMLQVDISEKAPTEENEHEKGSLVAATVEKLSKTNSSGATGIIIAVGVVAVVCGLVFLIGKYVWKRKFLVARVQSCDTIAYKLTDDQ